MPAAGPGAPGEANTTREFSLRTMPDLADHCIIPQPADWPDDSDRFPVVPMTTLLEVMARGRAWAGTGARRDRVREGHGHALADRRARDDGPGPRGRRRPGPGEGQHRGLRGRATCWWPAHIRCRPRQRRRRCATSGRPRSPRANCTATAGCSTARVSPGWSRSRRWPPTASRGTLVSLPALGALLDSAGQLIGHWMQVSRTADQIVLPTGHPRGPPVRAAAAGREPARAARSGSAR